MPELKKNSHEPNPTTLLQDLSLSKRRIEETERLSKVGFWELNHVSGDLYWSDEIFSIYNLPKQIKLPNYELWISLIHDDDREFVTDRYEASVKTGKEYDIRYRVKAGNTTKWIEARGITYYDAYGKPERSIGIARDISEIKMAQDQIKHMAYHDMLTGLANRKLFSDTLDESLIYAKRHQKQLAVLFIDLDNFKFINDKYGHDTGDEALIGVAKKLASFTQNNATFARIGGDEFAGLLFGDTQAEIEQSINDLKKTIDCYYKTTIQSFKISASIGVTMYPRDNVDADILLRHADQAMYETKDLGKSGIRYFDIARFQSTSLRRQRLKAIEYALANDQFELYYQPRVRLSDGQLMGAEALLRCFRSQGLLPPTTIVSALKNTPKEWALDKWVIKTALLHSKRFKKMGLNGPFSFNVNPNSIQNPDFPKLLQELLSEVGVNGEDVEIEILEVGSINDFDSTCKILHECKALGITFSLDDFGTGYSSLTHFHALPISKLKIDQRFIKNIHSDNDSLVLVKSILAIAKANNKPVVAEGVESDSILQTLAQLQCEYGQGFGIAKPMPADEYIRWAQGF